MDQTPSTPPEQQTSQDQINTDANSAATSPAQPANSNKKLLIGIGVALGALLIALIVLVAMVLGNNNEGSSNNSDNNSSQSDQSNDQNEDAPSRKVVKTVPTNNKNIEVVVYEPEQNASNTTIHYAFRNKCEGCEQPTYAGIYELFGTYITREGDAYLLDNDGAQKYGLIVDEDDKALATPTCYKSLEPKESFNCFAAFAKVPSGSTVNWVLPKLTVENIQIP